MLGHVFPAGGGYTEGVELLDLLAHHPSTAKFISLGLARHFVADHPPEALVDRMAQTFLKTDGDLRAVMETMFRSPEFFSEGAWEAKIKSPLEMVASTVRALGGEVLGVIKSRQGLGNYTVDRVLLCHRRADDPGPGSGACGGS